MSKEESPMMKNEALVRSSERKRESAMMKQFKI
jgi:hypothetical protein